MMELLRNAWSGWLDLMSDGKIIALFLLALMVCYFLNLGDQRGKGMFRYCGVMAAIVIFPLSAAILMLYQTKFYDYEWIWNLIPVTGMIACGEVLFWDWFQEKESRKNMRILMAVGILVLNILSGSLGSVERQAPDFGKERRQVVTALAAMRRDAGESICLWAPEEVISHARSLDGEIGLLYGRNMFEEHLNAYSYEVYPEELRELYVWMVMAGRYGRVVVPVEGDMVYPEGNLRLGDELDGRKCIGKALALGVNRILLPGNMTTDAVAELRDAYSLELVQAGNYYLLSLPGEEGMSSHGVR